MSSVTCGISLPTTLTGDVTINSGNKVESQKRPLSDNSNTSLVPKKQTIKGSSTISENSAVLTSEPRYTELDSKASLTKGVHCQRSVTKTPAAKSTFNPLYKITYYIKSQVSRGWKWMVSIFFSSNGPISAGAPPKTQNQKTNRPITSTMSAPSVQIWSPHLKTQIFIPDKAKDPDGYELAFKAFIITKEELIALQMAKILDEAKKDTSDWTESRKHKTKREIRKIAEDEAKDQRAEAQRKYLEHIESRNNYPVARAVMTSHDAIDRLFS